MNTLKVFHDLDKKSHEKFKTISRYMKMKTQHVKICDAVKTVIGKHNRLY